MKRKLFVDLANSYNFLDNSMKDANRTFACSNAHARVASIEQITLNNHGAGRVRLGFNFRVLLIHEVD